MAPHDRAISLGPTQKADDSVPPLVAWSLRQLDGFSPAPGAADPVHPTSAPGEVRHSGCGSFVSVALDSLSCWASGGAGIEAVVSGAAPTPAPGESSSVVSSPRELRSLAASWRSFGVPHSTTATVQQGWDVLPLRLAARF